MALDTATIGGRAGGAPFVLIVRGNAVCELHGYCCALCQAHDRASPLLPSPPSPTLTLAISRALRSSARLSASSVSAVPRATAPTPPTCERDSLSTGRAQGASTARPRERPPSSGEGPCFAGRAMRRHARRSARVSAKRIRGCGSVGRVLRHRRQSRRSDCAAARERSKDAKAPPCSPACRPGSLRRRSACDSHCEVGIRARQWSQHCAKAKLRKWSM